MNVQEGDLAIIVAPLLAGFTCNVGRIVKVGRYYGRAEYLSGAVHENCWLVHGSVVTHSGAPYCSFSRRLGADGCIPDELLRPIRDPGDGAVDEVLQRIGSPNEVTA